ncbi:MAG: DNA/RNA nuclease SfsA [Candidatus Acetothermia bacterium]
MDRFELFRAEVVERDSRVTVIARKGPEKFRAHLRNTGRLEDLINPGASVACHWKDGGKTDARLIGTIENGSYVLLDTHVQEKVLEEELRSGGVKPLPSIESVEEQVTYRGKRFDFAIRTPDGFGYLEIKSAVTCRDGWASYPDAPSERGLEHVKLLTELASSGGSGYIGFVVTNPECHKFRPDREIHPEMGEELVEARENGVEIFALKMILTPDGRVELEEKEVPVELAPR